VGKRRRFEDKRMGRRGEDVKVRKWKIWRRGQERKRQKGKDNNNVKIGRWEGKKPVMISRCEDVKLSRCKDEPILRFNFYFPKIILHFFFKFIELFF
jgi:hypothetical protein